MRDVWISYAFFDGQPNFANTDYFETKVLEVVATNPELRPIIIDAQGINHPAARRPAAGSGMNDQPILTSPFCCCCPQPAPAW